MNIARSTVLAALLVATTLSTARAGEWSTWGGDTLPATDTAVRAAVGWPDIHAAYHFPFSDDLEIAGKLGVVYGWPVFGVGGTLTGIGNVVGAELRWEFFEQDGFHLALRPEVSLLVLYNFLPDVTAGMRLGIGVAANYEINDKLDIITGLDIPFELYFEDPFVGLIPILFNMGIEYFVSDPLSFFAVFRLGPTIVAAGGSSDAGFGFEGRMGISYRFF
jgi:hypothetical protein